MLQTIFGKIYIATNGKPHEYQAIELPQIGSSFKVDKRYNILMENIPKENGEVAIECVIKNESGMVLKSGSETGENLALISFLSNNIKLSIGTIGDIPGICYEYQEDGMILRLGSNVELNEIRFYVAWLTMSDIEKEETYTWFAADPAMV